MARDGGGGRGSPAAERRRVALRALLASGAEAARAPTSKGLLRGLRCTSAAASQAIAPETPRPPADWRGLGCAAASQAHAHAPAAAADWRGLGCAAGAAAAQAHAPRRAEERRERRRRRKARGGGVSGGGGAGVSVGGGDVWCTPGVPFAAEASSVDCVVAPHQTVGTRRRAETDRPRRERPGAPPARRVTMREHMSSSPLSSPPHHGHGMPFIDADRAPYAGRIRHMSARRHSHARVDEEMMFRTRMLLGRMGIYDQYQDWRLDVDNMTYEELLDLEDRIGYVSTGLREDEIVQSIRMVRCSAFNPKHFPAEVDRRCSICQEEFEADEETGKLSCGHGYHVQCIKQWLSRKNACPVCKTAVSKT